MVFGNVFIKCNCISLSLYFARLTPLSYICLIYKTDSPVPSSLVAAPVPVWAEAGLHVALPLGLLVAHNASLPAAAAVLPHVPLCRVGSTQLFLSHFAAPFFCCLPVRNKLQQNITWLVCSVQFQLSYSKKLILSWVPIIWGAEVFRKTLEIILTEKSQSYLAFCFQRYA